MKSKITSELGRLNLSDLVAHKSTYPSWSTHSKYDLHVRNSGGFGIEIYYHTKSNRKISRVFPKELILTKELSFLLGLIKGEGLNKLGESSYRRVTFTNSNEKLINFFFQNMEKNMLYSREDLINKSIHIHHHTVSDSDAITYWSNKLKIDKSKFVCFDSNRGNNPFGVCHVYISDVLLRRVLDILIDHILS